jgi:exodeoxyribonuclease III
MKAAKIVSWNVNSIRSRFPVFIDFLGKYDPDIILLQEIKCETEKFPSLDIQGLGYNVAIYGQKTFNGVAILSKSPIEDIIRGVPGEFKDDQARYIECITYINGSAIRVASVYVPNGQDIDSEKFFYKLKFLERLSRHLENLLSYEEISVIGGDFNVAPEEIDVYDPDLLKGRICFNIKERKLFREILKAGYYDSFRIKHPGIQEFSWWDYRGNSFLNNHGLRIDHIIASPEAADKIVDAGVYKDIRKMEKTSDHAPIVIYIETVKI